MKLKICFIAALLCVLSTSHVFSEPIEITIKSAVLIALENNESLKVERFQPQIYKTFEDGEQAAFDPVLTGKAGFSRELSQRRQASSSSTSIESQDNFTEAGVGVSKFLSTGTNVGVDVSTNSTWSDLYNDLSVPRIGFSVTQALLRGRGTGVNLASLHQARLDTRISQFELRGFVEALICEVEKTYWDYALALRNIQILKKSLKVAEQQLKETEELIGVGKLPETEITSAQAEIALQRQGLINVNSAMAKKRLRLLQLLNPPGANLWQREVLLKYVPGVPRVMLDSVESHVEVALRFRPVLNEARLSIKRGDLEVVKTRNGLLPKLDLFLTLGKTGYADSFGSSVSNMTGDYYDFSVGINVRYPFKNAAARAGYKRSLLRLDQAAEAVNNLSNLVEMDVRTAYIEVNRTKEQISASKATRKLQKEQLRIETEKFRVGRSTMFLVAQAQRDFLESQISETQAIANCLKALVELYRLEGSLLERRGIMAPGREPARNLDEKQ